MDVVIFRHHAPQIAQITAAVNGRIAVQKLAPATRPGKSNAIIGSRNRRQVHDHNQFARPILVLARKGKNTVAVVRAIDPIKSSRLVIRFPQRGFCKIKFVQVLHKSLQSGMVLLGFDSAFQQMVVGVVLVGAVGIDTFYRRRTAKG